MGAGPSRRGDKAAPALTSAAFAVGFQHPETMSETGVRSGAFCRARNTGRKGDPTMKPANDDATAADGREPIPAELHGDPLACIIYRMSGSDATDCEAAELELEELCQRGDGRAQRVGLMLVYQAWQRGELNYADFVWRAEGLIRCAVESGTMRDLFNFAGAEAPARAAHAEFVCVIDRMADRRDEAGIAALAAIADQIPAATLMIADDLRRMEAATGELPPPLNWDALGFGRPVGRRAAFRDWLWNCWFDLCEVDRALGQYLIDCRDRLGEIVHIIRGRG